EEPLPMAEKRVENNNRALIPSTNSTCVPRIGGRITYHIPQYLERTSDKWVLDIVSRGHTREFIQKPPNTPPPGPPPPMLKHLLREVYVMLHKGAIE
ncbi:hypothetical protein NDU88_006852, partial [Pleurodeles waltl]